MGLGHTRVDLQSIAQAKLDDAILLVRQKRYANAYYLAGYAVEIGLKACIALQLTAETIPHKELLRGILTHEFSKLVGLAGLQAPLKEHQYRDPIFAANWAIACEWSPDTRYELIDPTTAQLFISAISATKSGVVPWIKTHW